MQIHHKINLAEAQAMSSVTYKQKLTEYNRSEHNIYYYQPSFIPLTDQPETDLIKVCIDKPTSPFISYTYCAEQIIPKKVFIFVQQKTVA